MDLNLKKTLRGISLEIRRLLEGRYDEFGVWQGGDLERRLNEMGVWRDREAKPVDEMPHLSAEDKAARRLVDGFLKLREEAGVPREEAVAEFARESAYTWANRLFALRCMEARGIIDEVILQKDAYGGRSLAHNRVAKKDPEVCAGEDDGLFTVLFAEFVQRSQELPVVFDPKSPAIALRPSVAALKRCVALLSGKESLRGQDAATDQVFAAPDAFGWAYQYWNADEKDRVFEMVRTKKGAKIQGADIIPATQLYTEPYMVKFLVQNSLGAHWMGMYPDSKLCDQWEYFVKDADCAPATRKPVREITFLDPAQGSGHFHLEAFDLFYAMYEEEAKREGRTMNGREICAAILNHNLYGIDIDGRSVQIATAALWMKAKECAFDLDAGDLTSFHDHLVATNIRLPKERNHLEMFLEKHPEDIQLRPALELVFKGLEHADELGSLLQIEELVDAALRRLKEEADKKIGDAVQTGLFEKTLAQGTLPLNVEDFDKWKTDSLNRLQSHFESEGQAADSVQAYFGDSASKGLAFLAVLSRRFSVVVANPPYMGSKNMSGAVKKHVEAYFKAGKRDLYAAFILQCIKMAEVGGSVGMVTMNKWLHARAYAPLRCGRELSATGIEKGDRSPLNILVNNSLISLADLGSRAFDPENKFHDGVQVALLVLRKELPTEHAAVAILDCTNPRDPEGKSRALRALILSHGTAMTLQGRFVDLPGSPVCYKLSDPLLGKIGKATRLGLLARVRQGICTTHDPRFVRMFWETSLGGRWKVFAKGGGHKRWDGLRHFAVDWENDGRRIKEYITDTPHAIHWSGRMPEADFYFKGGFCFSRIAFGSLGVRLFRESDLFGHTNPVILFDSELSSAEILTAVGLLNSPITTFLLRAITQSNDFPEGYLRRFPWPKPQSAEVHYASQVAEKALGAAAKLSSLNLIEVTFESQNHQARSFLETAIASSRFSLEQEFIVCAAESVFERLAFLQWGLSDSDIKLVESTMGSTKVPKYTPEFPVEAAFLSKSSDLSIGAVSEVNPRIQDALKLRAIEFMNGVQNSELHAVEEENTSEEAEEEDIETTSAPIPPFGAVDAFAREVGADIRASYFALRAAINDGKVGDLRLRSKATDLLTQLVLHLLGHRWPKQIEAGEQVPEWADSDGIIPLTESGGEKALIGRVRDRLPEMFPDGNVPALEREFEQIMGVSLVDWLAGPFFERHISQFKKRPISWQIESDARGQRLAGGKRKRGEAAKTIFSCLVYYHKLDAGILPKIRTHYVGKLRAGFETEQSTLERMSTRTSEQESRRLQLDAWIEEMKAFDAKLEVVAERGFASDSLWQHGLNDALLSLTAAWLRRLNGVISTGPLVDWRNAVAGNDLHPDFPAWIGEAFSRLDHFCAVVGPKPPDETTFSEDPTTNDLAPLVCANPTATVARVLALGCDRWWKHFDEAVLEPLKESLKQAREEQKQVKEELKLDEVKHDYGRNMALSDRKDELAATIKTLGMEIDTKTAAARTLRVQIERWTCPDADGWEAWLCSQPLFDIVASMDGRRPPPVSLAEFIAQESAYAPDINDGVRVNIAPVQKAGLLHATVLDTKDLDKAIADRADWRADERRWVREGKLPQPGWWPNNEESP